MKHVYALVLALVMALPAMGQVLIVEIYGGGGNTGAPYTHDYAVLYNESASAVDLTGWSLQYGSATGSMGGNEFTLMPLSGTIQPLSHFFVQLATGNASPTPNFPEYVTVAFVGTANMSATAGKIAVGSVATSFGTLPAPAGALTMPTGMVDFVGFGTNAGTHFLGTGRAPAASNTSALRRKLSPPGKTGGIYQNTGDNSADFEVVSLTTSGPLPVELTSFDVLARGSSAVLNWVTASETNNAGFAIEQRNGETWNTLGFVEGQGTTDRETSYAFTTEALTPGVHAFRLRQTDFDGTTSFSPIVEVAIVAEEDALTLVGANPFAGRTTARIAVTQPQAVTVELFDVTGRRVSTVFSGAVEAFQSIDVDGTSLAPGMYILRATGERFVQSRTLTVVR